MKKPLLALLTTTGLLFTSVVLPEAMLAQRVVDVSPDVNSQNVPPSSPIYGQFDAAGGAGVDIASVRILVNGQDVTSRSTITRNFFSYRPDQPLPAGAVQVQVQYRNTNGEQRNVSWNFTVQQPQAAVQITSVTHNAANNPLGPGTNFLATINGTPGSQATILLVQDGRTVRELPAQEVSSGVYVASLTVQSSDRVNEGVVVGRLRRQTQATYGAASQPLVFSTSAGGSSEVPQTTTPGTTTPGTTTPGTTTPGTTTPGTATPGTATLQPTFTSHQNGGRVGSNGFTLVGQTRPNATVRINVTSGVSVLGVSVGGETLIDRDVTANSSGQFQIQVPAPRIPVPGTRYTVRATARSGSETSAQTQISLTQ